MRESPPSGRSEPRDIVELRRLRQEQPDLASAVDLQIELLQLQRRVQSRVTLPSIRLDVEYLNARLAQGPILDFEQIPVDWSDLRFLLRATATAMRLGGSSLSAVNSTSVRYIASVIISPCAKFTTRTTPKITDRPSAISP